MMVIVVVLVLTTATAAENRPHATVVVYVGVLARHLWWEVSLLVRYWLHSMGSIEVAN
jgi:hypothetical protein